MQLSFASILLVFSLLVGLPAVSAAQETEAGTGNQTAEVEAGSGDQAAYQCQRPDVPLDPQSREAEELHKAIAAETDEQIQKAMKDCYDLRVQLWKDQNPEDAQALQDIGDNGQTPPDDGSRPPLEDSAANQDSTNEEAASQPNAPLREPNPEQRTGDGVQTPPLPGQKPGKPASAYADHTVDCSPHPGANCSPLQSQDDPQQQSGDTKPPTPERRPEPPPTANPPTQGDRFTSNDCGVRFDCTGKACPPLNNPMCIEKGDPWLGRSADQPNHRFLKCDTPEACIRAGVRLQKTYEDKHGLYTINDRVHRYAGPHENDTQAYIDTIAKKMGIDPHQPFRIDDPVLGPKFTKAVVEHETGGAPYTDAQIYDGWTLATQYHPTRQEAQIEARLDAIEQTGLNYSTMGIIPSGPGVVPSTNSPAVDTYLRGLTNTVTTGSGTQVSSPVRLTSSIGSNFGSWLSNSPAPGGVLSSNLSSPPPPFVTTNTGFPGLTGNLYTYLNPLINPIQLN